MKNIKYIILFLFMLLIVQPVSAETEAFVIDHFEVEMNVQENGLIDVVESLDVTFSERRHGLYFDLPTTYQMQFTLDGQEINRRYHFPISNIKVKDHPYEVESQTNGKRIKIGDADKYVSGAVNYTISYQIKTMDLGLKGKQMLYVNLISGKWNTDIKTSSFIIHMPKPFDTNAVNFYLGDYGSKNTAYPGFQYEIAGSTIFGNMINTLHPKEAVTLQVDLPNDYFAFPKPVDFSKPIIGFSVGLAAVAILLFYRFGKDDVVIRTVEFEAPIGLTAPAISYVLDGNVSARDMLSIIIEWANAGYLSIEELDSNNLKLIKEKDMGDERLRYERRLFKALFGDLDAVETNTLQASFYVHMQTAIKDISRYHSKNKETRVFSQSSLLMQGLVMFAAVLPTFFGMLYAFHKIFYSFGVAFLLSIVIAMMGILVVILFAYTISRRVTLSKMKFFGLLFIATIAALLYFLGYSALVYYGTGDMVMLMTGVLCTIAVTTCALFMDKRTTQGVRWYGQILGLKDFILTAEKGRLEALVHLNPQYFYHILPYAYVLGVSDVWSKKFANIMMENAVWYHSEEQVPVMLFMPRYYRSMNTLQQLNALPEIKISNGGGNFTSGSSGGGFSGGGFGGSSGGSW